MVRTRSQIRALEQSNREVERRIAARRQVYLDQSPSKASKLKHEEKAKKEREVHEIFLNSAKQKLVKVQMGNERNLPKMPDNA